MLLFLSSCGVEKGTDQAYKADLNTYVTLSVSNVRHENDLITFDLEIKNVSSEPIEISDHGVQLEKALLSSVSIDGKQHALESIPFPFKLTAGEAEVISCSQVLVPGTSIHGPITITLGVMSWKKGSTDWHERAEGWTLEAKYSLK